MLAFVQSSSPSVVFEAAYVLTQLSQAPTAIRAVANCYVQLLVSHCYTFGCDLYVHADEDMRRDGQLRPAHAHPVHSLLVSAILCL